MEPSFWASMGELVFLWLQDLLQLIPSPSVPQPRQDLEAPIAPWVHIHQSTFLAPLVLLAPSAMCLETRVVTWLTSLSG